MRRDEDENWRENSDANNGLESTWIISVKWDIPMNLEELIQLGNMHVQAKLESNREEPAQWEP